MFKICSYVQKMTPNPINSLEITIYKTPHTKNVKVHFHKSNLSKIFKPSKKYFYYVSKFHSSYFVHVVYFVDFIFFVYIYTVFSYKIDRGFVMKNRPTLFIFVLGWSIFTTYIFNTKIQNYEFDRGSGRILEFEFC